jgi:hypothetical protein
MMKRILTLLMILIMVNVVCAAEVCVIVDYGKDSDLETDSKCVDVDGAANGY